MRIGLKLLTEINTYETYRFSIFNIAKLKPINSNDVEVGTYVWDLSGNQYTCAMPIYDIENLMTQEEQKFSYAMLLTTAKLVDQMQKKSIRKPRAK
jgi:hypothetical protein